VRAKLPGLTNPDPATVLRTAGAAVATANPSTMAALVGGGLLAAAKAVGEAASIDRRLAAQALAAVEQSIATRGKAAVGDKTILDAIAPSRAELESGRTSESATAEAVLDAMVAAARRGVETTAGLQSRRGRAAWLGERSIGHPDPGATAYLRFLEALRTCWTEGDR
jgi:dihydroxyacetone kinase-like protein